MTCLKVTPYNKYLLIILEINYLILFTYHFRDSFRCKPGKIIEGEESILISDGGVIYEIPPINSSSNNKFNEDELLPFTNNKSNLLWTYSRVQCRIKKISKTLYWFLN